MIRAALLSLALMGGAPALAQDPGTEARAASDRLNRAAALMEAAEGAANRVKALTEVVGAYEDGLEAMREGLRRAAIQEEALSRRLQSREDEIARLLGVLQSMAQSEGPVLLLHPSGPIGTARSGMILSDVTPALETRAAALRAELEEVTVLRQLQQSALDTLREGLQGAQDARTALSQAIADRTDLPRRFVEDPVKTALLVASTETLEGFASGLSQIAVDEVPGSLPGIDARKGSLRLPVEGRILRRAGEADAAGIVRPGILMATRPRALVTTPAPATLRYRGELLDYGNVVILEPQAGLLMVFAGLDVVYGEIGEVLPGGSPIGMMGAPEGETGEDANALLIENEKDAGASRSQTLYIELREDNEPVDPETWFETSEG
ncbi:murein hydrolase activator EnvC family protein [Roseovarius atlanticus]|uniref:murein hydrolase activator EnvC family protein n=1 Tax=Roseovarius atlanticus TaxID=1641875 RepID=UPI001C954FDB|nr:peptidase M23 [Roseovarius atlanticus]MBY5989640.1 peptidase M23 [Roseovarius atlanticus]MBY6126185.1 peptidase M23 [Roseovarius atlanticus]MBY6150679.1 peptidase M23 [Roseovarius atlanticus]